MFYLQVTRLQDSSLQICYFDYGEKDNLISHQYDSQIEYSDSSFHKNPSDNSILENFCIEDIDKEVGGVFRCPFCPFYHKYKSLLKQHMMIHTGEKPFACNMCSYRGTQKNHLDKHMKTHTGEKAYSCDQCSYRATQKHHLEYHLKTHTSEKPFECSICKHRTKRKESLIYHMRVKHSN